MANEEETQDPIVAPRKFASQQFDILCSGPWPHGQYTCSCRQEYEQYLANKDIPLSDIAKLIPRWKQTESTLHQRQT